LYLYIGPGFVTFYPRGASDARVLAIMSFVTPKVVGGRPLPKICTQSDPLPFRTPQF